MWRQSPSGDEHNMYLQSYRYAMSEAWEYDCERRKIHSHDEVRNSGMESSNG